MTALPSPPAAESAQLDDCARRLGELVERSAAFVQNQLARLEELSASDSRVADRDEHAEDAEWRREQTAWERRRDAEEARIEEQITHLVNAWRELEVEQRRLLMQGQPTVEPTVELQKETADREAARPNRSLDLVEESGSQGMASSAFQFQRLKREIRQQTQRKR